MSRRCAAHPEHVERFVHTLRITPHAREGYGCTLRGFQRFALKRSSSRPPSMRVLRRWAQRQCRKSPRYMVESRARLIDRFLSWMTARGVLDGNPFEQLRQQYRLRGMPPIIEALLSEHPEEVLERRRRCKPFGSCLGGSMQAHVARMRALGCRYNTEEKAFLRFDRFLQSRPDLAGQPLKALVETWSKSHRNLSHVLAAQRCGRALSQSLHRLDPKEPVLTLETGLQRRICQRYRRPHIYSEAQILKLLETARTFPSPFAPLRPLSLYTMVVLTYCAGLRVGELVRLRLGDIDLKEGTIEIRDTKFFKSRRLPLSVSALQALQDYLAARAASGAPKTPQSSLFVNRRGSAFSYGMAELFLTGVIRRARLKPPRGRRGPHIHDLRHTFVVHRMLDWYRNGINPQTKLPYLATYLGHKDITSTLTYLNLTPEVLGHASERWRQYGVHALGNLS